MMDDLAALRLQLEWGVDEALGPEALDRLAPPAASAAISMTWTVAPVATAAIAERSRALTLDALFAEMAAFEGCKLRHSATSTVRPDGEVGAATVVIGEAPGAEDDRSGRAFSGAAGLLLDRVLGSAGLDRRSMVLTTLVPWRPPGGRKPTDAEIQVCLPFVYSLLSIVRPRRLVLLGSSSAKALSSGQATVRAKRGNWVDVTIPMVEMPVSALILPAIDQWLSSPTSKQRLWTDLLTLQKAITTP